MKIVYALCGLATILQLVQTDARSDLMARTTTALPVTPAPVPTRTVAMRDTIVPTWDQVVPAGASKVKLQKVKDFWAALEKSDLETFQSLFSDSAEKKAAKKAIEGYYDDARACMGWYWLNTKRKQPKFLRNMASIGACIDKKPIPTFKVPETISVVPAKPTYVPEYDDSGPDDPDDPEDLVTPSPSPSVVVQSNPSYTTTATPWTAPLETQSEPASTTTSSETTSSETSGPVGDTLSTWDENGAQLGSYDYVAPSTPAAEAYPTEQPASDEGYSMEQPESPLQQETEQPEPTWDDLHPPGWNGGYSGEYDGLEGSLPTSHEGYSDVEPTYSGYSDRDGDTETIEYPPQNQVDDYQPSWDDLHPPGWNDDSLPPSQIEEYPNNVETIEYPPQNQVDDYQPSWDDLHPPGWNDDGIPPQYRDGYTGDDAPDSPYTTTDEGVSYTDHDSVVEYPQEPVHDYRPSWDDLHPPGWNDDGIPPQYRDGYTGDDYPQYMTGNSGYDGPDTPFVTTDEGRVAQWAHDESVPAPEEYREMMTGGHGIGIPPWALDAMKNDNHPDFEFKPTSPDVPPFWALDFNSDSDVSENEWQVYLQKLKTAATSSNARARDSHAKGLIDDIIAFHYANLHDCISQRVESHIAPPDMPKFAWEVFSGCYVKFRYSLFAGAAPFEWVAHKQSQLSGDQISQWFMKQLQVAKSDVVAGRIRAESLPAIPYLERSISCLNSILESHESEVFDRTKYYKLVEATLDCVNISD